LLAPCPEGLKGRGSTQFGHFAFTRCFDLYLPNATNIVPCVFASLQPQLAEYIKGEQEGDGERNHRGRGGGGRRRGRAGGQGQLYIVGSDGRYGAAELVCVDYFHVTMALERLGPAPSEGTPPLLPPNIQLCVRLHSHSPSDPQTNASGGPVVGGIETSVQSLWVEAFSNRSDACRALRLLDKCCAVIQTVVDTIAPYPSQPQSQPQAQECGPGVCGIASKRAQSDLDYTIVCPECLAKREAGHTQRTLHTLDTQRSNVSLRVLGRVRAHRHRQMLLDLHTLQQALD